MDATARFKQLKRCSLLLLLGFSSLAVAEIKFREWAPDPDVEPWKESGYTLPPFPKDADLIEFVVGEGGNAKYFIDQTSISTGGNDNVVRYVLVVKMSGGAVNTSYEGLQCEASELKVYATGRADRTWVEVPNAAWRPLRRTTLNRHQGVLFRYYFCPTKLPIANLKEGVRALKEGGHSRAKDE